MNSEIIKIGTRGSKLALWQAYLVQNSLKLVGWNSEIVTIETKGDIILDKSLSKIGSKGVFTEELETQLRQEKIDIAVHSAKDMQSSLDDDFEIIAFTEREKVNDVLVSNNPNCTIDSNLIIGTSSTRRRAQLKHFYPNVQLTEMRGNLQTRMHKLENGHADALLLAYAGVHRMEFDNYIIKEFDINEFTPAVGQGSIAIQSLITLNEPKKYIISNTLNHSDTHYCISAERSFLRKLDGGCSVPVFGNAILTNNLITLTGGVVSLDGKTILKEVLSGKKEDFIQIGEILAQKLIDRGANELLCEIRKELAL